jgi:hypothetical protein
MAAAGSPSGPPLPGDDDDVPSGATPAAAEHKRPLPSWSPSSSEASSWMSPGYEPVLFTD